MVLGASNDVNKPCSRKATKDISHSNVSLKVINARNLKDSDMEAPLLPPDKITIAGSMFRVLDPNIARAWYKKLAKDDYNSSKTRRNYVIGSYYSSMYGHQLSNIIEWKVTEDIDIKVMLKHNLFTYIKIRKCSDELSNSILILHNRLKNEIPNSCRHKYGDKGKMYALGKKNESKQYTLCVNNPDICEIIKKIVTFRKKWFVKTFPDDHKVYFDQPKSVDYMQDGLSDTMIHSVELCNSSHYDVFDKLITVSTWIEEEPSVTENWFLVFPNVTCDGKKAIVIKLFHGCTISWDASLLRHASSQVFYRIRGGGKSAGNCELRKK